MPNSNLIQFCRRLPTFWAILAALGYKVWEKFFEILHLFD